MTRRQTDFIGILKTLHQHRVEFIIVGGVCAVLHGAPVATFDLDLVHCRSLENLEQLIEALSELEAIYRGHGQQVLTPVKANLSGTGHHLLMTKWGPLDLLGTIGHGRAYEELLTDSTPVEIAGLDFKMLHLKPLIDIKMETATEKDRAVLPILMKTLEEKDK